MKHQTSKNGFTLVELMITIGIVAILVALAIPSYSKYILKANRGEAQHLLLNWANNQEIWRAGNTTYADENDIAVPSHDKYTFTVTGETAIAFILTADATGDQANDTEKGKSCDPLTLDQSNAKTRTECW